MLSLKILGRNKEFLCQISTCVTVVGGLSWETLMNIHIWFHSPSYTSLVR